MNAKVRLLLIRTEICSPGPAGQTSERCAEISNFFANYQASDVLINIQCEELTKRLALCICVKF